MKTLNLENVKIYTNTKDDIVAAMNLNFMPYLSGMMIVRSLKHLKKNVKMMILIRC